MDNAKHMFIEMAVEAAEAAGHPFPVAAACEAAMESAFGKSLLVRQANNLFGMKQHQHPTFGTITMPTREYLGGQWKVVNAAFVQYPDVMSCFADRVATLRRLAPSFPHYQAALVATDEETYIREVSKSWSTDPNRANVVLQLVAEFRAAEVRV